MYMACFSAVLFSCICAGCKKESEDTTVEPSNVQYASPANSTVIYAPISENDLSRMIKSGMSREELLKMCGEPLLTNSIDGVEELMFNISFEKINYTTDRMLSAFSVSISNNIVQSWRISGEGRVIYGSNYRGQSESAD